MQQRLGATSVYLLDTDAKLDKLMGESGAKSKSQLLRILIDHAYEEWEAGNARWLDDKLATVQK